MFDKLQQGPDGRFRKCRAIRNNTRSNGAVYPIGCDRSRDVESTQSTPAPTPRRSVVLHPPSYSEALRSDTDRPIRSPPPPFLANQNSVFQTDSNRLFSDDVSIAESDDISIDQRNCSRPENESQAIIDLDQTDNDQSINTNASTEQVSENNRGGVLRRPQTADYARPPTGDPFDVRDFILPNSPPPAYGEGEHDMNLQTSSSC